MTFVSPPRTYPPAIWTMSPGSSLPSIVTAEVSEPPASFGLEGHAPYVAPGSVRKPTFDTDAPAEVTTVSPIQRHLPSTRGTRGSAPRICWMPDEGSWKG